MSEVLEFSDRQRILDSTFWSQDIDQLYHPSGVFPNSSFECVYSFELLNTTKFDPILIKEWFSLVEVGGHLVIDYSPSNLNSRQELEENLWWLLKDNYDIAYHGDIDIGISVLKSKNIYDFIKDTYFIQDKAFCKKSLINTRIVIKKNKKTCVEKGNINEWTFGIVTNGSRPDSVLKLINSIRAQNIGRYEVIICGSYKGKLAKDMRLIDFSFRDDLGWITRKKNKIILESKYENLIIMHDRLFLKDDWFEQVRKWGNSFEVLAMPQIYFSTGQRLASWQHYEFSANSVYKWNIPLAHMDYLDWGKYMLDCGAITAGKKTILKKILFNETLYWGDFEDCVLSNRLVDSGYIFRLVPNAIVYSGTNSLVSVVNRRHLYDKNRLGKIITKPFHIYVAYKILDSLRVYRDNKLILPIFNRVMTYLKNKGNIITHRDL